MDSNLKIFKEILIVFIISLWAYWLWCRRHLYKFALQFPGYWGIPFLGLVGHILRPADILPVFGKQFEKYKKYTLATWICVHPILLTAEPELIQLVLKSPDLWNKADVIYGVLLNNVGGGLFTNAAKQWHPNRKLLNPAFHHKVLLSYLPIFERVKENLIVKLNSLDDGRPHKIFHILQSATLGTAIETTLGTTPDGVNIRKNEKFKYNFIFILNMTMYHVLFSFMGLSRLFNLNTTYRRLRSDMWKYVQEYLEQKLNVALEQTKVNKGSLEDKHSKGEYVKKIPKSFVDHAITVYNENKLSYHDVVGETNNAVMAAFETTANSIFSTILMLAMHPDVQERLFEEIRLVFPQKTFQLESEHLSQFPYLDMVFNEVIRLSPPIPIIGRQVVKDTKLTASFELPKNLVILISIFHLHRRKDIWGPNADKFNPDNFLQENISQRSAFSYIPFSKGARNCIGSRYAYLIMKSVLLGLVRNFRFTTDFKYEDLRFVENLSLRYLVEPKIQIHKR